jgi:membrane protein
MSQSGLDREAPSKLADVLASAIRGAARHDWRGTAGATGRWARTRPYHLLPWIALTAAVGLWPRRPSPPQQQEAVPGLSDGRIMSPDSFDQEEPGRGRKAEHPHHIPLLGWRDILWRTALEVGADKLPSVAGGVTFYALLAIFPAIGAFVSLYGLFFDVGAAQAQLREMGGVFPASVVQIVGDQMLRLAGRHDEQLTVAFVVSLLLSVWSANAGMNALFEGLNVAYDEQEKRPYWRKVLITYGCTFGALLFITFVAGVLVAVPVVLKALYLTQLAPLWTPLRWLVVLAGAAAAFSLLYRFGPCRAKARWRWISWGAAGAAFLWLAGSLGFSWYVNNLAHYDATYGPLGAVIGFMMWIWFSILVLLLGAELNAEIEHQTALDSTTGAERPMGERGATMADTVGQSLQLRQLLKREGQALQKQANGLWKMVRRK